MFSQGRHEPPLVPREAFLQMRSLASVGHFADAIRTLEERGSLGSCPASAVHILKFVGRTAVEERDYGLAHYAYQTACTYAQQAPRYGPVDLLQIVCDASELSTLAFPQSKFLGSDEARAALEDALADTVAVPDIPLSAEIISKVIMAAGEVGSTEMVLDMIEDYCNGQHAQHLNSAATQGLLELLLGHEYVRFERTNGMRLLHDAQEAYLKAYRILRDFPEYDQLKSYALLCAARVAGMLQDGSGKELYLTEAAHEFVSLPQERRSPASAALILEAISSHAALAPHFRSLFQVVFERADLPIHHLVAALALWSRPHYVSARRKQAETPEQEDEIDNNARQMVRRAQQLACDVVGVSNLDRILLSVSGVHLMGRDGDGEEVLEALHEGLAIAAVDPRGIDLIFPLLVYIAWDQDHAEHTVKLCSMFDELIQIDSRAAGYDDEVADFKCHLVVGLVNSLSHLDSTLEQKAKMLTRALRKLEVCLMRRKDSSALTTAEVSAFARILEGSVELVTPMRVSRERSDVLIALRDIYGESLKRRERLGFSSIESLRGALRIEQAALAIFECLGEVSRYAASSERADQIQQEIENRIAAGEVEESSEDEDLP